MYTIMSNEIALSCKISNKSKHIVIKAICRKLAEKERDDIFNENRGISETIKKENIRITAQKSRGCNDISRKSRPVKKRAFAGVGRPKNEEV